MYVFEEGMGGRAREVGGVNSSKIGGNGFNGGVSGTYAAGPEYASAQEMQIINKRHVYVVGNWPVVKYSEFQIPADFRFPVNLHYCFRKHYFECF